jgi:hypothetical protein
MPVAADALNSEGEGGTFFEAVRIYNPAMRRYSSEELNPQTKASVSRCMEVPVMGAAYHYVTPPLINSNLFSTASISQSALNRRHLTLPHLSNEFPTLYAALHCTVGLTTARHTCVTCLVP